MEVELSGNYGEILRKLKDRIRQARLRAILSVNKELLQVYWEIGNIILSQQQDEGWGTKVIDRLVTDLKLEFPDMKGLSSRNIKYMRAFATSWPDFVMVQRPVAQTQNLVNEDNTIVQHIIAQLPWGHICSLLDKLKENKERLFYAQKAVEQGWTRNMLVNQVESGLYRRQGALTNNFSLTLPKYESELAAQLFKDPYHLDFVMLGEEAKERDLENALMTHITKLLLELGDGFAFMGRQKKFEAGDKEFFIDLLFYNTKLRRHIIIELKIGDFEPEYVSKMNLYLGLADDTLKGAFDEPSIGLILCKTNNKIVAEYALRDTSKPIGIAEYKIAEKLPEDIKGELPSIAEIEQRMDEELKESQNPIDARLKAIKSKLKSIEGDTIQTQANFPLLQKVYFEGLKPLYIELISKMHGFEEDFLSSTVNWTCTNKHFSNIEELDELWKNEADLQTVTQVNFHFALHGLKKAGTENRSAHIGLNFMIDTYWYGFVLVNHNNQNPFLKKLYHQPLTSADKELVIGTVLTKLMDEIDWNIERITSG